MPKLLMIRPTAFGFNEETASNNHYQHKDNKDKGEIQDLALREFNNYVKKLKEHNINTIVFQDTLNPPTPDSIFPNNWFASFDDKVVIFPMFAKNRREEINKFKNKFLEYQKGKEIIDLSPYTDENKFLEGTGSIILDRKNKTAYACLSPRTDKDLFIKFCEKINYTPIYFNAYQDGNLIYHTNVMMSVNKELAIVCLDTIIDSDEREKVINKLKEDKKIIIDISLEQVKKFLGNVLEVDGFMIMSQTAYNALTSEQLEQIQKYSKILPVDVSTIEFYGGGSARCMIGEVY